MNPRKSGLIDCFRRRVRTPILATHRSFIGVFHWQRLGPRFEFGVPACLPCLEGLPDLLDGQRLDGQGLRALDAALALDRTEGGLVRRVELPLMT